MLYNCFDIIINFTESSKMFLTTFKVDSLIVRLSANFFLIFHAEQFYIFFFCGSLRFHISKVKGILKMLDTRISILYNMSINIGSANEESC